MENSMLGEKNRKEVADFSVLKDIHFYNRIHVWLKNNNLPAIAQFVFSFRYLNFPFPDITTF